MADLCDVVITFSLTMYGNTIIKISVMWQIPFTAAVVISVMWQIPFTAAVVISVMWQIPFTAAVVISVIWQINDPLHYSTT